MIDIEANPGTAVLLALFVGLVLLGVATLSGTLALLIWVLALAVAFFVAYAVFMRLLKRARGETTASRRGGGQYDER
jgi:uncharacterized protein (DUF58 family)